MKKIIIKFVQAFYTKKNSDAMRFFCLTKKNFLLDDMPTQPLYYTLFRGVLSEEGSEEREREREREREFYTKVYQSRGLFLEKYKFS